LADLIRPESVDGESEDGLNEEELEILREAGIIAAPTNGWKSGNSTQHSNHILFVEDEKKGS